MSQKRIYAYISPELKQALEAAAKEEDRSESYIVSQVLKSFLATPVSPEGDLADYLTGVTPQPTPLLDAVKRRGSVK